MFNISKVKGWLEIATLMANKFSKDPSTKVGAVILRPDGSIASMGYNGYPQDLIEKHLTYDRDVKYASILHAEENALAFAREDLAGCVAIVTHHPCAHCLAQLMQKKIRCVYYGDATIKERFTTGQLKALEMLLHPDHNSTYLVKVD